MIKIKCFDITQINKNECDKFYGLCSRERREKVKKYYQYDDVKRSVCAEMLVWYSLADYIANWNTVRISYNTYGKPFVEGVRGFHFNISHSGKWVMIAYADTIVGVDIEKIREDKYNITDKFFLESEQKYINSILDRKERNKRFINIWTLKECYIKYLGTGLYTDLKSFYVDGIENDKIVLVGENMEQQNSIFLKSYLFDKEYYLSVCSLEKELQLQKIGIKDLMEFCDTFRR